MMGSMIEKKCLEDGNVATGNSPTTIKYTKVPYQNKWQESITLHWETQPWSTQKNFMIMRQYFPWLWCDPYPLHARGPKLCLFLVRWSVICCQDGCLMAFAKGAMPEEYLSHNFESNAWEDTRPIWCLSYPSGGAPLIPGHYVSW